MRLLEARGPSVARSGARNLIFSARKRLQHEHVEGRAALRQAQDQASPWVTCFTTISIGVIDREPPSSAPCHHWCAAGTPQTRPSTAVCAWCEHVQPPRQRYLNHFTTSVDFVIALRLASSCARVPRCCSAPGGAPGCARSREPCRNDCVYPYPE